MRGKEGDEKGEKTKMDGVGGIKMLQTTDNVARLEAVLKRVLKQAAAVVVFTDRRGGISPSRSQVAF